MTADHQALRERIEAFDIDGGPAPDLPFAARLARANRWSRAFADRAVREYRRFAFLAMTAGRPMCPSEQVDQVWHLHLTYTRSYWQRFCGEVLKAPLHHDPTRGGVAEGQKHRAMYADTLRAYEEAFGEPPPADLWPPAEARFGRDLDAVRVNRADYWLVRKPRVPRRALAAAALMVAVALALGCAGNPFEARGTDFLPYYFAAWGLALALGLVARRVFKGPAPGPDDPAPDLGPYDVAYLTGGRTRVVTTALVRLKDLGLVDVGGDGKVIVRRHPHDASPVENAVFGALAKQAGNALDLRPLGEAVRDLEKSAFSPFARLAEQGLVNRAGTQALGCFLPAVLVFGTIGLVGVSRLVMGLQNHRPSGYLVASLVGTGIISLIALGRPLRRTRKADAALANLSQRHTRLRTLSSDPAATDAPLAVALFGATVLAGTAYAAVYDRVYKYDAAGSGGGCSTASGCGGGGDSGGGGGCGGGCGGCGGGGGD